MAYSPSIASNPLPRRGREIPSGGGVGSLSSAYSMSSLRPAIIGCTRNQPWSSGHWSGEMEVRPGTKDLVPNEKEVLRDVNGRFSAFIDKVHRLEVENEKLEAEVLQLRDAQASVLESTKPLRAEVEGLRDLIRNLGLQKAADQLTSQRLEEDIQALWLRGEQEARIRESTEATIRALENEISHAHQVKADLHQKVLSFLEEIEALKKSHEKDMGALRSHLQSTIVGEEKKQSEDLSSTLRDIRTLLLSQPTGDLSQAEEWFRIEAAKLSQADQTSMETLRAARQELKLQARQLQGKSAELDAVLGTRGSLERQITELEERHDAETCHLQVTMLITHAF
ncbi:neurofilament medium polypeptide-like [Ambystoma mexicanum]|uniref:neurofilament medium polypeptide-like n=1 Tax=Ambystoma mexicanum TaxID=8296 RepID=UPI0037E73957